MARPFGKARLGRPAPGGQDTRGCIVPRRPPYSRVGTPAHDDLTESSHASATGTHRVDFDRRCAGAVRVDIRQQRRASLRVRILFSRKDFVSFPPARRRRDKRRPVSPLSRLKRNDGDEHVEQPTPAGGWLAVLSVMLFGCFAISLGPLFWLAIYQIYPLGVRGFAMGIATMTSWGFKSCWWPSPSRYWLRRWARLRLSGFIRRRASRPWCSGTALFRRGKGGRSRKSLCTGIAFADCQNCATRQGLRPDTR